MKLNPHLLLTAYTQGIFPMANENGSINWYEPDPRAILPLDQFHVPHSLARTIRQGWFEVRMNTAFEAVITACAEPAPGRESTWISPEIIAAYTELHRLGFAHSVECWQDGRLVGGLYGVGLRGLFAGESMFSRETDSSKTALVYLVNRLKQQHFKLLDVQFLTPHLQKFGAIEIPAQEYQLKLFEALLVPAHF